MQMIKKRIPKRARKQMSVLKIVNGQPLPDEVPAFAACRKNTNVEAVKMNRPFSVDTDTGDNQEGDAGDYLMRGVKGELYPCPRETFESSYDFVESQPPVPFEPLGVSDVLESICNSQLWRMWDNADFYDEESRISDVFGGERVALLVRALRLRNHAAQLRTKATDLAEFAADGYIDDIHAAHLVLPDLRVAGSTNRALALASVRLPLVDVIYGLSPDDTQMLFAAAWNRTRRSALPSRSSRVVSSAALYEEATEVYDLAMADTGREPRRRFTFKLIGHAEIELRDRIKAVGSTKHIDDPGTFDGVSKSYIGAVDALGSLLRDIERTA